ncbi:MAG: hypothetical protein JW950_01195 [Deltaproteobacteria bacterium]|nr:hypothetical protein [Deltaproteobacteria bacterium]
MEKASALKQRSAAKREKRIKIISYPAFAGSVDLPVLSYVKRKDKDEFFLLPTDEKQLFSEINPVLPDHPKAMTPFRLKMILAPMLPACADSTITINIIGHRAALLKVKQYKGQIIVDAHWNLFIPYFVQIAKLPIAHPEILDIFASAVVHYVSSAMRHPKMAARILRSLIIDTYRTQPALLLASLDIFNKQNIYRIHPEKTWFNAISAANDKYRLQIDVSTVATAPLINPKFLAEITSFIHKVVKNYAFRYVDYLWTQRYKIVFGTHSGTAMVAREGKDIFINISPLIHQPKWKPALYLSLGYAIMLSIIQSSGREDEKESIYLAMTKTWNRYLSFDESAERQSVCELCRIPQSTESEQCSSLVDCMTGKERTGIADDFVMFLNYSAKEAFGERMNVLNESPYGKRKGIFYERLLDTVQDVNAALVKNNINYSNLIEILRNDNIDHLQLEKFLRTGRLDDRNVVDVSEWLLLRTLLYDLINTRKVFKNDYKMLLKVLTKVNKTLIVYLWTLGLVDDARHEVVSAYIAKLINDIFVFDRVQIYEIVADPVECLEAEAVTGYLLNWASRTQEERRSVIEGKLSALPLKALMRLSVETVGDVDVLIRMLGIRANGLIGFYLHQVYRWGSTSDAITERIRSYFPELLKHAQEAILPDKIIMGGAMLLLLLAQIISDERDGIARNIVITPGERQVVLRLIKQCVSWDQRHFVMMVAGIAAGYMGSVDGWILQLFDTLLGRYRGGDRVVLRSVVQLDVENLIERTLIAAKDREEGVLLHKIQLLRIGVDPVVSDQANKVLRALAFKHGIQSPETILKKRDIRELVLKLAQRMKGKTRYSEVRDKSS